MKNLKLILIVFIMLSGSAFAETDLNGLEHPIKKDGYGFIDLEEDQNLKKRDIRHAGKEVKKIYGDIATIGATISLPVGNSAQGRGYDYVPRLEWLKGSVVNVYFVKDEKTGFSFNSAKATFDFSDVKNINNEAIGNKITGKNVIFARLYWAGAIANKWHNVSDLQKKYFEDIKDFQTVKFKTPKGLYTIKSTQKNTKWYGSYTRDGMQFMYQASADVTDLVKASLGSSDKERTFAAGDIKSTEGDPFALKGYRDNGWSSRLFAPHYGGWALAIIYDFGDTKEGRKVKPKGVNIYDGLKILAPIHLSGGQSTRLDSTFVTFSGFYTPISGAIKSSLTVLSFGAKYEVDSEDLQFKKGGVFKSVSSTYNNQGSQFNGTITKFGKHMNKTDNGKLKKYHNQMDLDIYDISEMMSHGQTSAEAKLTAKVIRTGSSTFGERENIGLVAFSTDLYEPKICYMETLLVRDQNKTDEKDFKEVSTDANNKTIARKGDTLRVQLRIVNDGDEEAQKIHLNTILDANKSSYLTDTTYIKPSAPRADNFSVSDSDKNLDNTNLQTYNGTNELSFYIGDGAKKTGNVIEGGTIRNDNQAFIQFDTKLGKTFARNSYTTKFRNDAINLFYDGKIEECKEKKYELKVGYVKPKIVNKKFKDPGNSENLFTQIAGKKFDVKFINMFLSEKDDQTDKELHNFDIDSDVYVDVVEPNTACDKAINVIDGNQTIKISKESLKKKKMIDIKEISISKAYPTLLFRFSYTDKNGKNINVCESDSFAVRPKELVIYNKSNGSKSFGNLVGGKEYNDILLKAIDNSDNTAQNYSTKLKPIKLKKSSLVPEKCEADFAFLNDIKIMADMKNGLGQIKMFSEDVTPSTEVIKNFVYPNVGHVSLEAVDTKWTQVDKDPGGSSDKKLNDCILNSDTTKENIDGKIGCDIKTKNSIDLKFIPNDIFADELKVSNFDDAMGMTYISNDTPMGAKVNFKLKARLGDSNKTIPSLYKKGCYSQDNNFTINIDQIIDDFKKDDGSDADLASVQAAALYFDNDTGDHTKKTKDSAGTLNNGTYNVSKDAFDEGIASSSIKINFARDVSKAKNPFTLSSQNLTLGNISDADGVSGAAYTKPATETSSQFYYGIAYAPDYEGLKGGFDAKVYFGIYCSGCDTTKYTKAKDGKLLPRTSNWFVNKSHNDKSQGEVSSYVSTNKSNPSTIVVKDDGKISQGIQTIKLSNTRPVNDTIRMNVSTWLIYDKSNPAATFNKFNVTFLDTAQWGGRALNNKGEDINSVGNVLDSAKGNLSDFTNKSHKRSDW